MKHGFLSIVASVVLVTNAPAQSDSLLQAGLRLVYDGRAADGIVVLLRAGADTGTAAVRGQLGLAYASLNNFPEARRFLDGAVALAPENAALRFQYARFLHQNLVLSEADRQYQAVLARDSGFAPAWFQLAQVGKLLSKPDSLLRTYYEAAVRLGPEDYLAHYYLGLMLLED